MPPSMPGAPPLLMALMPPTCPPALPSLLHRSVRICVLARGFGASPFAPGMPGALPPLMPRLVPMLPVVVLLV